MERLFLKLLFTGLLLWKIFFHVTIKAPCVSRMIGCEQNQTSNIDDMFIN